MNTTIEGHTAANIPAECVGCEWITAGVEPWFEGMAFSEACYDCGKFRARQEEASRRATRMVEIRAIREQWPIPARFSGARLAGPYRSPYQDHAARQLCEWLESLTLETLAVAPNVIMRASSGVGKTHIAAACLRACEEEKLLTCAFANTSDIFETLRRMIQPDGRPPGDSSAANRAVDALVRCDVLLLDDVGNERCTEWVSGQLYYIINKRYNDCRPTIITTNYGEEDLKRDRRWAAILSRLIGGALIIVPPSESEGGDE